MINFCTLFNANYLSRGLALYDSLCKTCPDFNLYVFAFDDNTYDYLKAKQYPYLIPVSLKEFEDNELLAVKPTRSAAEYCWTSTPSTILFCIEKFNLPSCTYIDADMLFYSNPAILIDEMGNDDVLISEHRYTKFYDQSAMSGIYCVQFMCFKNTSNGMKVLKWWRNACLDWCYARFEEGRFGDQKYLDNWTTAFEGVHVMQHAGGGIAPWNVQQFDFNYEAEQLMLTHKASKKKYPVVFFHFHGLKFYDNYTVQFAPFIYELNEKIKDIFFAPYAKQLLLISDQVKKEVAFNPDGASGKPQSKTGAYRFYLYKLAFLLKKRPFYIFNPKIYNFKLHYHNKQREAL
jgi:hypothetical protein